MDFLLQIITENMQGPRHALREIKIHKLTPFFCRQFLVRVSCKSGTGFVWWQTLAPIRMLVYSKSESCVHVT